jgi:hypothetical protein
LSGENLILAVRTFQFLASNQLAIIFTNEVSVPISHKTRQLISGPLLTGGKEKIKFSTPEIWFSDFYFYI